MTSIYLTVINERFVVRALALYRSLIPYLGGNRFAVYCVDDAAADLLEALALESCSIFRPGSFETGEIRKLKSERAVNEYCWTLKPVALAHAFSSYCDTNWGIYLDSDMMVFGNPDKALPQSDSKHGMVTPHRPTHPYFTQFIDTVGIYNAGYVAFRNSTEGRRAVYWWRDRCLEDSPRIPRNGAYADQRYLNRLPALFEGIVSSSHKGLNAGPWNILNQPIGGDESHILVGDDELLTYHMQGFRILGKYLFDYYAGPVRIPRIIRKRIYYPYACVLAEACRELSNVHKTYVQLPDSNFWTLHSILQEIKRAAYGRTNLGPTF